jgi:hypothetical protein
MILVGEFSLGTPENRKTPLEFPIAPIPRDSLGPGCFF